MSDMWLYELYLCMYMYMYIYIYMNICSYAGFEAAQQCETAWLELCMIPKTVRNPAPRKGKKHQQAAENFTKNRLEKWLAENTAHCGRKA